MSEEDETPEIIFDIERWIRRGYEEIDFSVLDSSVVENLIQAKLVELVQELTVLYESHVVNEEEEEE